MEVGYQLGEQTFYAPLCYFLGDNETKEIIDSTSIIISNGELDIYPIYQTQKLNVNFQAKPQKGYVELSWEGSSVVGSMYDALGVVLDNVGISNKLINISSPFDDGTQVLDRGIVGVDCNSGYKVEYSNQNIENFGFDGNNQIVVRFCNTENVEKTILDYTQNDLEYSIFIQKVGNDFKLYKSSPAGQEEIALPSGVGCDKNYWIILYIDTYNFNCVCLGYAKNVKEYYPTASVIDSSNLNVSGENNTYFKDVNGNVISIPYIDEVNFYPLRTYEIQNIVTDWSQVVNPYVGMRVFLVTRTVTEGGVPKVLGTAFRYTGSDWQADMDGVAFAEWIVYKNSAENKIYYFYAPYYMSTSTYEFELYAVNRDYTSASRKLVTKYGQSALASISKVADRSDTKESDRIYLQNVLFDYMVVADLYDFIGDGGKLTNESVFINNLITSSNNDGNPSWNNFINSSGEQKCSYLAKFNNGTSAGQSVLQDEDITGWQINRINHLTGESTLVARVDGSIVDINDYNITNSWLGHYEISPVSYSKLGYPVASKEIETCFWDYSLLILDGPDNNENYIVKDIFYWKSAVTTGEMNNNTSYSVQETLGVYRKVSRSRTNAMSGSLQALLGYMSWQPYQEKDSSGEMVTKYKWSYSNDNSYAVQKLREAQYSNNLKLLRDRNGMNFLIEFTSPISYSQDTKGAINTIYSNNGYTKNLKVQPTSIKLSWIEVGSADDMQIITK